MSEPESLPKTAPAQEPSYFSCVPQRSAHDVIQLRVSGELDIATVHPLTSHLRDALAGAHLVVLDLGQVEFIDCSGLGAIIAAHDLALSGGRRLLIHSSAVVDRLVTLTGLVDRLNFIDPTRSSTAQSSASEGG